MLNMAAMRSKHRMLPDPRQCTLFPRNPAGGDTPCTGYRRPWSRDDAAMFGPLGVEPQKTVFLLAAETLSGAKPLPGWMLTDNEGNSWTIQGATLEQADSMYRCPCLEQEAMAQ